MAGWQRAGTLPSISCSAHHRGAGLLRGRRPYRRLPLLKIGRDERLTKRLRGLSNVSGLSRYFHLVSRSRDRASATEVSCHPHLSRPFGAKNLQLTVFISSQRVSSLTASLYASCLHGLGSHRVRVVSASMVRDRMRCMERALTFAWPSSWPL